MDTLFKDIRYAARGLSKHPTFAAIAILTLALGIGANTAIFSVTDKLLLRSLAVRNPEQLFLITSVSVSPHFVSNIFSYPDFNDYRKQNRALDGLTVFSKTELELKTNDRNERITSEYVGGNYFDLLGVAAAQGRTFAPDEDVTPGSQPVVVISENFRRRKFGAENPIGKSLTLNNVPLTIIGVAPDAFRGLFLEEPTDVWVPVLMHPQLAQAKAIEKRGRFLNLLGRTKAGVGVEQSERDLDALVQQIKEANTPAGTITKGLPFSEQHIKFVPAGKGISVLRTRFASPLKLLMVVVTLVLLIACTNIAGLLLARGISRRKEMAIRLSLGANSWRVARQLLTESLLLAVAGGVGGLVLAPWIVSLLIKSQSRLDLAETLLRSTLDKRVLAFTVVSTLIAGLFFGVLPAWQSSKAELVPSLKDEGTFASQGERRFSFRGLLVVVQLALAIVVLIGAGLCVKSLRNLLSIDPGYQAENLLVIPLELDEKKYDEVRGAALQRQALERLGSLPGVESVSYGGVTPFSGRRSMSSLFVEGQQPMLNEQMAFDSDVVGPHYHETMGIKIIEGRGFTEQDRAGSVPVIIVNEALAQRLFPGEKALGRKVTTKTNTPGFEIIGITHDVKHHELTETLLPHFDLPALQSGYSSYTNVILRTSSQASLLTASVRNELLRLDSSLDLRDIASMSSQVDGTLAATRLASTLIAGFGLVALLLASIGLYGVMSWIVGRRTREVGIRMALGAQRKDILKLVLTHGFVLSVAGVGLGVLIALVATRLIDTQQLYEVSATDPFIFVAISVLLIFVSLLACYLPARRATKVDPLVALRYE
ncbi:MAG TPA: ABC transporter permease [Pyrinomonadaceae bacterium]|jgi:Acidobacterial duplicated orphan permease|nr:ABC transporter permease [Pyrinomonadaceae bacterium]